jgi:UDP-N-acetylmuramoyl-L-alanyl-D-glutamate--2,6-diaminopimelate ligase
MASLSLPINFTLQQLLPEIVLPKKLIDVPVSSLCLDSRAVKSGGVFVAVSGLVRDGRDYIDSALESGAVAVLAEASGLTATLDERVVLIQDLNKKLSDIAGRFFDEPSDRLALIGVTGTNGKTTCSQLLAQLLSFVVGPAGVMGTLGCGVVVNGKSDLRDTGMTTPDAIETQAVLADCVEAKVGQVVMEVSSHSLDQFRVQALTFHTAVFTNLSRDHLDYHGDLVKYAGAKMQLFAMPGLMNAVINLDDPVGAEVAIKLPPSVNLCGYSLLNSNASIFAEDVVLSASGLQAYVHTPWGSGALNSHLLGRFNLQNLLAVVGAACLQGLSLDAVLKVIPKLQAASGRMELLSFDVGSRGADCRYMGPQVVVDFAHTPDALENVLMTLRDHCDGQLWCVFGCGGDRDRGKRPQMAGIASRLADRIIVTSDNPRSEDPEAIISDICDGLGEGCEAEVFVGRAEAIHFAIQAAADNDIVLLAGKGHESYQLIGSHKLPFSDQTQARLALRQRGERDDG